MTNQHALGWMAALAAGLVLATAPAEAPAGNWPQWRGPNLNGSAGDDEKLLPVQFSPDEDIAWAIDTPGVGAATPIIWGDRVFITAMEQADPQRTWALCISRTNGKVAWKQLVGNKGFGNRMGNTAATPSAITDGRIVIFQFGTGELLACDMDGKLLWKRNLQDDHGKFTILWQYGATGLLYKGLLYVPVIQGPTDAGAGDWSYLLCVDPNTGKDIWKHMRTTGAVRESKQAYSTPIPQEGPGGPMILVSGGDYLTAHDPRTGKELWRSTTYNPRPETSWRLVVSPCVLDATAIVCAPKGGRMFAVPTDRKGQLTKADELWSTNDYSPDVCTPLAYKGRFYVLDGRRKQMACIEPRTGKVIWANDLPTKAVLQASATGADGKIYCVSLAGEVLVLQAGDQYKLLHSTKFPATGCRATISVSNGQLFLRTDTRLYCIGKYRTPTHNQSPERAQ
jgi:outer membrane protein assembly factor BamB